MKFLNAKNTQIQINWCLTDDMRPNIKNYSDDYDKNLALKNFLIRSNIDLCSIDKIMNAKDPFWETFKMFKTIGEKDLLNNGNFPEEVNFERNKKLTEIRIIENADLYRIIDLLFYAIIENIVFSAGYMYITDAKDNPFSKSTYTGMLISLSEGEVVLDDTIITAFHIVFSRSKKNISDFLKMFDSIWEKGLIGHTLEFAKIIGGVEYLKALFCKNIENSIKNHKSYSAKKIIDNNNINTSIDIDIHNVLFSSDNEGNQTLFAETFDIFKEDILKIREYVNEALDISYNKKFDLDLSDSTLYNKKNYNVSFTPYTTTGRKSKFPFSINGEFNISDKQQVLSHLFYNQKGTIERIEIYIQCEPLVRKIVCKEMNKQMMLFQITEQDISAIEFSQVIYKNN